MVIEHTFVTTMEAPETLQAAAAFLQGGGFAPVAATAKAGAPARDACLEMGRGKTNAARAKSVAELPQYIRLDFDRGRVGLAISITPSSAWGGSSFTSSDAAIRPNDKAALKRLKLHMDMLNAILSGLEQLLAQRVPAEVAGREWLEAEARIAAAARRRKRQSIIAVAVLGLVIAMAIGIVVYAVS